MTGGIDMAGGAVEVDWSIARATNRAEETSIEVIWHVEREEYERLHRAIGDVVEAIPLDVFEVLARNMEAIDSLHSLLARRFGHDGHRPARPEQNLPPKEFTARILSALSNYLSSGRMYTDSMSDILSARYGKESTAYTGFKADLASLFEENPGYRFTYHLRNALQHVGSLPLSLRYTRSDSADERVRIVADRDQLLDAYDWHKRVRADLLSGPADVELLPLLRTGYAGYVWLERRRVRRCYQEIRDQVLELSKVVHELEEEGSALLLMAHHDSSEKQVSLSHAVFPYAQFLDAVTRGYETDDFDQVLPRGYERPQPGARKDLIGGIRLDRALDLLDAQYSGGRTAAIVEIGRTIAKGPQESGNLISSLLSLSMISLLEIEMAIGESVESQLCSWRREQKEAEPPAADG